MHICIYLFIYSFHRYLWAWTRQVSSAFIWTLSRNTPLYGYDKRGCTCFILQTSAISLDCNYLRNISPCVKQISNTDFKPGCSGFLFITWFGKKDIIKVWTRTFYPHWTESYPTPKKQLGWLILSALAV